MTLAEFEVLLTSGEVIEETTVSPETIKELVLIAEWTRPLHVVVVVDNGRREERIVTVYEPDPERWLPGLRKRRG